MNTVANMKRADSSISVITLNDPNTPMKKQRLSELIKQQDQNISCLQEILLKTKRSRSKVKRKRKIYYVNTNQKKARITNFRHHIL